MKESISIWQTHVYNKSSTSCRKLLHIKTSGLELKKIKEKEKKKYQNFLMEVHTHQTPTGRDASSHSTVAHTRWSHTLRAMPLLWHLEFDPVCHTVAAIMWSSTQTHTLGHQENGPVLLRSHGKQPDILYWEAVHHCQLININIQVSQICTSLSLLLYF